MATVLGNDGSALGEILGTRKTHNPDGVIVRVNYTCDKANVTALLASADQYGDGHADHPDSKLREINEDVGPKFSRLEFVYAPEGSILVGGGSNQPVGTVTRSASANLLEIPIEKHGSWSQTWKDSKPGVESYLAPLPVYRRSEVIAADDFGWTEDEVVENTGKLGAPIGMGGSPTATDWLKIERDIDEIGESTSIHNGWQYNPTGWDTDIYSTA